ncbi:MAG: hypothetical protein KC445_15635, partial [Anaerolineales bacterium]|nr:hypothetical protein [Anaerolineales bacterium]
LVTMNGGVISNNSALHNGGAMEIRDELGQFILNGGEIANNSAVSLGGAIYNDQGTLTVNGGTIHSNSSDDGGGAIATNSWSHTNINAGAILTNTAVITGGAIYNQGTLTVTNSTFSGNSAATGAAVANEDGTATLTNVTISANSATANGGGVSNNTGSFTVGNSIVYGNTAPSGADCTGSITSASAGHNISSCGGGDINSDPLLQPLALNDGSNLNFALVSGSPALNAGDDAICTAADQRGNLRPVNVCDIGAYEYGIAFFISDASLTEGNSGSSQMSFIVSRSFMTNTTTTVDYATVAGTAVAGADFTAVPSTTLTFLPGTMTQTATVPILGDTFDEEDEQFTVVLGNPTGGAELGVFSATGTILDDDEPLLTINDATAVSESDAATKTAVFTVTMSITSTKVITVNFATADGTATIAGNDYTANSGTLTFNSGEPTKTVEVTILDDALDEDNEVFTVGLSNATNATISDASGQGTITDDDAPVGMRIANTSITEGNSGTTVMSFVVSLDAVSGRTITVNYATANGTAVSGSDYIAKSGTLTFTPGQTQKTINISIKGDVAFEGAETVKVNLTNGVNVTILDGQGIGTINNNDLGYFLPMIVKR